MTKLTTIAVRIVLLFLCFGLLPAPLAIASSAEDAVLARSAFEEGDFAKAAKYYDALLAQGIVNGHLYYNAGLTHYRLGKPGQALAAFLAARSLLPRDPDVRANIASVLGQIENKLDATPSRALIESVAFWIPMLTLRELLLVTAVCGALVGALIWLTLLVPKFAPSRAYAWWLVALPVLCLASAVIKTEVQHPWGAVTAPETAAYSGPGKGNTLLFQLANGAPFRVLDDSGDWLKVELTGGKRGWLAHKDLTVHPQF